jgi:ribonuclease-3
MNKIQIIEERLGYAFLQKALLEQALIHRSYANENKGVQHNERLEFLGDSVLGLVAAEYLYLRFPEYSEGDLSQTRARLVEAGACAKYFQKFNIQEFLLLGKGEKMTEGKNKLSILADAFEAIVGAIYLDGGLSMAKSFWICHFEEEANQIIGSPARNYKAELQDRSQQKYKKVPTYKVLEESGPDHAKIFRVAVYVNDEESGIGIGKSKKEAEQQAAFEAIGKL